MSGLQGTDWCMSSLQDTDWCMSSLQDTDWCMSGLQDTDWCMSGAMEMCHGCSWLQPSGDSSEESVAGNVRAEAGEEENHLVWS